MKRVVRAGTDFIDTAASFLAGALRARLDGSERVSLAVSGGSTPVPVFRRLAAAPIDWRRVDIYQVDERVAPIGDPARNLTGLSESLLDRVPAAMHPMPVEASDLDSAAVHYAEALPVVLDVVHLGLGEDGHTASLVPDDSVLEVSGSKVALTEPYRGHRRMTLTFEALNTAREIIWLVRGAAKASMTQRLCDADPAIPAGRIAQRNATLITDETI